MPRAGVGRQTGNAGSAVSAILALIARLLVALVKDMPAFVWAVRMPGTRVRRQTGDAWGFGAAVGAKMWHSLCRIGLGF